jgi:hypothetical protein
MTSLAAKAWFALFTGGGDGSLALYPCGDRPLLAAWVYFSIFTGASLLTTSIF